MRRARDFYETAPFQTRAMLDHVPEIGGVVLEPCTGNGSIARVLQAEGGLRVVSNDLDRRRVADFHGDASRPAFWSKLPPFDWAISNPPYVGHLCLPVVRLAVAHARVGVAMMLRLSFLEPTPKGTRARRTAAGVLVPGSEPRGPWLTQHPLARLLVLPRYSFTGTGTDSVTTAWCIWSRIPLSGAPLLSLHRADQDYAQPWQRAA